MSTSAFPFLDGRTVHEDHVARTPRPRTIRAGGFLDRVRRLRPRSHPPVQREQDRRPATDAYLDRGGLSSVDWVGLLTQQVHR